VGAAVIIRYVPPGIAGIHEFNFAKDELVLHHIVHRVHSERLPELGGAAGGCGSFCTSS
jgi:hypothetical protein